MTKTQNQCAQDFKARNNLNNYINFYHFSFSSAFTFESRWLNITPALQLGLLLLGWYHRCMRTLSLFIRDCCLFLLSLKHKTVLKIWLWGTSQMFWGFFLYLQLRIISLVVQKLSWMKQYLTIKYRPCTHDMWNTNEECNITGVWWIQKYKEFGVTINLFYKQLDVSSVSKITLKVKFHALSTP